MPELHYLIGDALKPIKTPAIICHVVNTINRMGRGFVVALEKIYPEVKVAYHEWFASGNPELGQVQFVQVTPNICIANMLAQKGVNVVGGTPPIRYPALELCLIKVNERASQNFATVHGPRFGAVLSGGDWGVIEGIIKRCLTVETYIYTMEKEKHKWPTEYE